MYIFLDESGKPEVYSSKGVDLVENRTATRYLVIATVKTSDQLKLQTKLTEFKATLLKDDALSKTFSAAYALDAFHANKDYPEVRRRFYAFINRLEDIELHVILIDKKNCREYLRRNPMKMYGLLAGMTLQGICHQDPSAEIIFSKMDKGKDIKQELELEVERIREAQWSQHKTPKAIRIHYQHNPHYSHGGLQIADYVAYAVYQYFEKGDKGYLEVILPKIRHIHNYSTKEHFVRSRPLKLS